MLNALLMASQALAFAVAALVFFTVLGLGLTEILLPADGFQLLLAPATGMAVLALGFQWLTFAVPPYTAALLVFVAFGAVSAVVVWRRWTRLLARWPDVIGAAVLTLAFFVALMQIVFPRGFFTLAGFPSDNVFIYVQAAQFLVDHSAPLPHQSLSIASPGVAYLITTGNALPNSVGPVDAAASVLSGWPVYALFDPINALALAITAGPVWFFVRATLGASWPVAAAAGMLLATNQLLYWVIGMGFQQESLALPVFTAGLGAAALMVRTESVRAGALTGLLGASLLGLYLPIAVLLLLCATGCVVVRLVVDRKTRLMGLVRPVAAAVAAGAAAALAALYVLLFQGGLSIWYHAASIRVPAGGITRFPVFLYLLGTLPLAHVWELLPQPYGTLERLALPVLVLASGLLVILLVAGYARALVQKHAPEAAILGAGILFVGYEAAVARYPYGFVKAIGYMVPLTSAFVAFGAIGLESLFRTRWRRWAQAAGAGALVLVILASALTSRDMVRLWLDNPSEPTFPRSYVALAEMAHVVPTGASVLVDSPDADYQTLVKVAAVAYFLPDRTVQVYAGDLRLGTFPNQDVRPQPCLFDYVVGSTTAVGFSMIYTDPAVGLNVYKRDGARCTSG